MITSLLHVCGLYLGPEKDFLPPDPDNPEGFWESRSFLRLNDAILKQWGGSWKDPPSMDDVWENKPRLHPLREKARQLVQRFDGREPWGWKDPRNCLTLPFWRKLLPDVRVLICVRNPLAVAESLWLRNEISYSDSFALWRAYNRRILAAAPVDRRLVTHCESYLHKPHTEVRRVLQWAGLAATEDRVEQACQRIAPTLIHHRMTLADLIDAGASADLLQCYRDLCDEARIAEPAEFAVDASTSGVEG